MKKLNICHFEGGFMVCYCGHCEAEPYELPMDYGIIYKIYQET